MAGSSKPGPTNPQIGVIPAKTPGPAGTNDQGAPTTTTALGNTPGPLGIWDWADPTLPLFCAEDPYVELMCKAPDGVPMSIGLGDDTPAPPRLDKDALIKYIDDNAEDHATGKCARYVRKGLEAGGIDTSDRPDDAKDYGPFLKNHGASVIAQDNTRRKKGT